MVWSCGYFDELLCNALNVSDGTRLFRMWNIRHSQAHVLLRSMLPLVFDFSYCHVQASVPWSGGPVFCGWHIEEQIWNCAFYMFTKIKHSVYMPSKPTPWVTGCDPIDKLNKWSVGDVVHIREVYLTKHFKWFASPLWFLTFTFIHSGISDLLYH